MRLTEELVARTIRPVEDSGPLPGLNYFNDEQYDENLREILRDRPDGPLQIFSYGSLIWKPAIATVATVRATAKDWHRSFCLHAARFRGTLEQPGLMMQIDRGGTCEGVVQQVDEGRHWEDLSILWRREMTTRPPSNMPRWIDVDVDGRVQRAIAFTANPQSPNYRGELDPDYVARRLAVACGHWGSGADYLRQTVISLEKVGIHDPYLWDMQERVAVEIEAAIISPRP